MPKDPVVGARYLRSTSGLAAPFFPCAQTFEFPMARYGLFHALRFLNVAPQATVLVPAYICSCVVDAIHAYGARVEFYRVDRRCELDLSDVQSRLTGQIAALLAVHYFGAPQPIRELRRMCDQAGVALIEDCAHVLMGQSDGEPLGSFGDVSLFSWRKFLPLYDGGSLVINRAGSAFEIAQRTESLLHSVKVLADLTQQWSEHPGVLRGAVRGTLKAAKVIRDALRDNSSVRVAPAPVQQSPTKEFDSNLTAQSMSRVSRSWLRHSDLARIASERNRNTALLHEALMQLRGVQPLWSTPPPAVAPWVFPLIAHPSIPVLGALRAHGVPAVSWNGVRPTVLRAGMFPDADFLYENLLFMPVHQDLQKRDLYRIVDTTRAVLCHR